jgi:hypothetical protein
MNMYSSPGDSLRRILKMREFVNVLPVKEKRSYGCSQNI